ncbi:hypothetical protein BGW36DRAFT_368014 [Talaromyces proteolyticus]|uniref:Required for respiratory growth protein 9, mitochondrial n=1 Tax=Talaromyces proteolyticus TaxID=1131652 RepID=A0AAD4Q6U6_9EURO|nr:uncharacterized protein BGW36DRAFT_368014 [Talaromyces proteolyticus]KAH8705687.1 hypothetical protein BGW36DRAFT_368014 [Talaromyces proteolyticus]
MPATCIAANPWIVSQSIRSIFIPQFTAQVSKSRVPFHATSQSLFTRPPFKPTPRTISPRRLFASVPVLSNNEKNERLGKDGEINDQDDDFVLDLSPPKVEVSKQEKAKQEKNTQKKSKKLKDSTAGGRIKTSKAIKSGGKNTDEAQSRKLKPKDWQIQKAALEEKFQEGWRPLKKLSPDTLDTIRHLHSTKPDEWTTPALAEHYKVSPEAIRRILKSRWQPSEETRNKRQENWRKRHDRIWSQMEEIGLRRPRTSMRDVPDDASKLGV